MPLRVVRRPKSPLFYVRGTIAGVRVEESTRTSDRKLADQYRAKREAEIYRGDLYGGRVSRTFAEAVLSYLEARDAPSPRFLVKVLKHFDTTPLARIDQAAIEAGARKIYPNAKPATRNRQFFSPTVTVLNHAARRGWCAPILVERPKFKNAVVRWITPAEADKLFDACAPHLRPLVVFLVYTGARVGEALWLDWRDVDLSRSHVGFPATKNGDARGVPLHPRVVVELANLPHREGCVFRRDDGQAYAPLKGGDDTSAGTRIKTAFKAACARAGIDRFRPHDCRHTFATWHYQQNRNLIALMKVGGWKSEKMVLRYAHMNVGDLAGTIRRLPGGKPGERANKKGKTA